MRIVKPSSKAGFGRLVCVLTRTHRFELRVNDYIWLRQECRRCGKVEV